MNRAKKLERIANRSANFTAVSPGSQCKELLSNHGVESHILPVYNNVARFFEEVRIKLPEMDDATVKCVFKEITLLNTNAIGAETKYFISKNKKKIREASETREYVPKELKKWKGSTLKIAAPTRFIEFI